MKIIKIEPQKRNDKRMNLYNEEGYFMSASTYVIKKYNVKEGKEYPEEELTRWIEEDDVEKAKNYIVDYLMGRTEHQIKTKLTQKGYTEKVIARAMEFMNNYGYLNDKAIGKALMNDSIRSKKEGRNKIKQKMYQKGIKKQDMEEVMEGLNAEEEKEGAEYSLKKVKEKYRVKSKDKNQWKQKCYQYLLRQGFPYELASEVMGNEEWNWEGEED